MTDRFAECLPLILADEGGWVNDPQDPGGETNLGITRAVYEAWTGRKAADMRHLKPQDVAPIYEAKYWKAASCDGLPAGLDYAVFDCAVNMGVGRAIKYLQRAVGVADDGQVGPATMQAVKDHDPRVAIESIRQQREAKYRSLPTFVRFGKGWLARLNRVSTIAEKAAQQ